MSMADPATTYTLHSTSYESTAPNPSTPSNSDATPHLSSPDTPQHPETPHSHLQTPAPSSSSRGPIGIMQSEPLDPGLGLGYGMDVKGKGRLGREEEVEIEQPRPEIGVSAIGRDAMDVDEEEGSEFPEMAALEGMQRRLQEFRGSPTGAGDGLAERDELLRMLHKLLSPALVQLPFLHGQVAAQRATIVTMQEQARLQAKLSNIERERHAAERVGWQTETRALMNARDAEVAAGIRPKKLLDLDVGYHQELEAANKRLEMDNRLMAPRLADTQRQIDKLVTELRHLRSNVILPTHDAEGNLIPQPQAQSTQGLGLGPVAEPRKSRSPVKPSGPLVTMGDARTEHLLLAARKVRAMRAQDDRVGRLTLEELKRGGVVGPDGGLGYSEGYGGFVDDDSEEDESEEEEEELMQGRRPSSSKGKNKAQPLGTPLLPRPKKGVKQKLPPVTPKTGPGRANPTTTPGGSNFNDLLRAAELATRPGTPSPPDGGRAQHVPMSAMSATRSTTRVREESPSESGSPVKRPRRGVPSDWNRGRKIAGMDVDEEGDGEEGIGFPQSTNGDSRVADDTEASALDLLAQASQLDVAQGPQEPEQTPTQLASASRFGGMLEESEEFGGSSPRSNLEEGSLAPAISLRNLPPGPKIEDHQIDPVLAALSNLPPPQPASTPRPRPRGPSNASELATPARRVSHSQYLEMYDDTPSARSPPPSVSRSESMAHEMPLGAFASPTGATVPGLGKYVHLTSSMPARRVRSPYLKWTVEEDELLARAVAIHGEKWDLVSKGVPTRSYHQVRQRWLRKTGAFDKKPLTADEIAAGIGAVEKDEEETSPTPQSGRTPATKMRKAS